MQRILFAVVVVGVGAGLCSGDGFFRPRTRPQYQPGIPVRDYQYLPTSPLANATSMRAVLIEARSAYRLGVVPREWEGKQISAPIARSRVKVFQLDQAELRVDHCAISRVAFTVHEDGRWTISLRATQNRELGNDPRPPFPAPQPTKRFTEEMKRNQFHVRVLAYGLYPQSETERTITTGKPVLFRAEPEPFWVQRVEPYDLWKSCPSLEAARAFDLIDRVEVEFFYR